MTPSIRLPILPDHHGFTGKNKLRPARLAGWSALGWMGFEPVDLKTEGQTSDYEDGFLLRASGWKSIHS